MKISDTTLPSPRPEVYLSWLPKGNPYSWSIGGSVFPETASPGAPDSPTIYRTPTNTDITFTASVRVPSGVYLVDYYWQFGDGKTAHGPSVIHRYRTAAQNIRVRLQVRDSIGRTYCAAEQLMMEDADPIVLLPAIVML